MLGVLSICLNFNFSVLCGKVPLFSVSFKLRCLSVFHIYCYIYMCIYTYAKQNHIHVAIIRLVSISDVSLYCTSKDLLQSIHHPTIYCIISGKEKDHHIYVHNYLSIIIYTLILIHCVCLFVCLSVCQSSSTSLEWNII